MATDQECRAALDQIAGRLAKVDRAELAQHVVERTISCRVPDLGVEYRTRIHADGLDPFTAHAGEDGAAEVRLTVHSDDLVALAGDELHIAKAWASGRLKIEASIFDLLRLRRLL